MLIKMLKTRYFSNKLYIFLNIQKIYEKIFEKADSHNL